MRSRRRIIAVALCLLIIAAGAMCFGVRSVEAAMADHGGKLAGMHSCCSVDPSTSSSHSKAPTGDCDRCEFGTAGPVTVTEPALPPLDHLAVALLVAPNLDFSFSSFSYVAVDSVRPHPPSLSLVGLHCQLSV